MSAAEHIISLFGGTRKLAAAIDFPPSTVQSWKDAGRIPAKHQPTVLDKAREMKIALSPADFFPPHSREEAA